MAEKYTIAPEAPVAAWVWSAGSDKIGGVLSSTVIVKLPLARFPAASAVVQFTRLSPRAKVLPEDGVQTTAESGSSTRSDAVAKKFTTAPAGPVASCAWSGGKVRTGAVVSSTVIWKLPPA